MTTEADSVLPRHIAVIMDGNSRWAGERGLPVAAGHRRGAENVRKIIDSCSRRGIAFLTLFAFSSENWRRPSKEVRALMALFLLVFKGREIRFLDDLGARLVFIGNRAGFSRRLQTGMREAEELTAGNAGVTVVVAVDYGGRWDMARAARRIAGKVQAGELDSADVDVDLVHAHTALGAYPDPDLCIRTGGERRISNFLLWQFAYTELYFADCWWPDFDDAALQRALDDFSARRRRYGGRRGGG